MPGHAERPNKQVPLLLIKDACQTMIPCLRIAMELQPLRIFWTEPIVILEPRPQWRCFSTLPARSHLSYMKRWDQHLFQPCRKMYVRAHSTWLRLCASLPVCAEVWCTFFLRARIQCQSRWRVGLGLTTQTKGPLSKCRQSHSSSPMPCCTDHPCQVGCSMGPRTPLLIAPHMEHLGEFKTTAKKRKTSHA